MLVNREMLVCVCAYVTILAIFGLYYLYIYCFVQAYEEGIG